MPIAISTNAAGTGYANPLVGPVDHTAHVKVDLSTLTTYEVDADGYLKPGVVLTSGGTLPGGVAGAGTATSAAVSGNTGNGTMGTVTVSDGAKEGVYSLVVIEPGSNVGQFAVYDPDGVFVSKGTVASAFSAGGLAFTLADGATDFVAGDAFTITVTLTAGGNATKVCFGVVVEPTKLAVTTPATNTTLAAETGDHFVAVCTHGVINRDIAEDNMGRAYSAAELAGFLKPGCHLSLTTT